MKPKAFQDRLHKLVREAYRAELCPLCIARDLLQVAYVLQYQVDPTPADLQQHGIGPVDPFPCSHSHQGELH